MRIQKKRRKQKILVTTDWHLLHENLKIHGLRPRDNEERIKTQIQELCRDDILINLGDVGNHDLVASYNDLIRQRGVKHWLCQGNHDKGSLFKYTEIGFDFVADHIMIKRYGRRWLFSHVPQEVHDERVVNVHGHLHEGAHRDAEWHEVRDASTAGVHKLISLEQDGFHFQSLETIRKDLMDLGLITRG